MIRCDGIFVQFPLWAKGGGKDLLRYYFHVESCTYKWAELSPSGTWLKLSHRYGTELERNLEQSRMFGTHCCRVGGGSLERRHSGGQAVRQTKTKTKSPWCNRELHQFKHLSIVLHSIFIVPIVFSYFYVVVILMGIVLFPSPFYATGNSAIV